MGTIVDNPMYRSISTKFMLFSFLIFFIIAFAATCGRIWIDFKDTEKSVLESLIISQKAYERGLSRAIWFMDEGYLEAEIKGIMENPHMTLVHIRGDKNQNYIFEKNAVKATDGSTGKLSSFNRDPGMDVEGGPRFIRHEFLLEHTAEDGESYQVGKAVFNTDEDIIYQKLRGKVLLAVINFFVLVIALGIIVYYFGGRILTKPLGQLATAIDAFDPDRTDGYPDLSSFRGNDELETVARAFSTMQQRLTDTVFSLRKSKSELTDLTRNLEAMVENRTADLTKSNTRLKNEIRERRQVEEALRESEERLRIAGRASYDMLYEWSVANDNLEWLGDIDSMLGYGAGKISRDIGAWLDLIHPEDRGQLEDAVELHRTNTKPIYYEYRIRHKDGSNRYWKDKALPMLDRDGRPYKWIGVCTDITDHKRAEEELRLSQERLRAILEASPDPVVVYDDSGCVTFLNPAFSRLFGWSPEELLGRRIPFVPEDQREVTQATIENLLESGGTTTLETKRLNRDGRLLDVLVSAAVIPDGQGRATGMVVNLTDLGMIRKMETQLRQAHKMESVGRLAGGVAHDFNNMLSVILGYTELTMGQVDPTQPLYENLQEIRKAAQRSADVTRQLLAFARKQAIAPKLLDLNRTVQSMLNMLRRLIGEDIDLVWLPAANVWPVRMDPSQIDQILANLCVNARDAIAGVGKLTIETGKATFDEAYCADHPGFDPGAFTLLAVSDDGCGMDKETLGSLFEPFYTTKDMDKGTGLGLATVYGIVKQNKGFINVYSEPNQGATFKIYLPRHETDVEQARVESPPAADARGSETVLLVEDEPAILTLSTTMLEHLGYTVLSAVTPREAIRLARGHDGPIHLLMTDVVMPEMNGRDLAGNLQSIYPNIKRLFMSGYTANVIAHHGVLNEGVNFLQKPFSMKDLSVKVREVLDDIEGASRQ